MAVSSSSGLTATSTSQRATAAGVTLICNGQNLDSLLGKLLRIDPRLGPNGEPYTIPTDNPFVGQTGARAEIWSYGLRNPWRFRSTA